MVFYCFSIHWDELNQYTAQGQSRNAFTDKFRPYREGNIELGAIDFLSKIQGKGTIISSGSDPDEFHWETIQSKAC